MLRALRTTSLLLLLLSILSAQQPPPIPSPGELPSGSPKRPHERIKPGLSDESEPAPAQVPVHSSRTNPERYQKLRRDTTQLVRLAVELKQSVDQTNAKTFSLEVIKKAEQIEKLAKNVKNTMKND